MSELATDRKNAGEEDVTAPAPESAATNGSSGEDGQTPAPEEPGIATEPSTSESARAESAAPIEPPSEIAESNGHSDPAPAIDPPAPPVATFEPAPVDAAASSSIEADATEAAASPSTDADATEGGEQPPPVAAPVDPAVAGAAATRLKQVTERLVT